MGVYGGIDLHSNNQVVALVDGAGELVYRRRLGNELEKVVQELAPYRERLVGVAVESTFNWYWLVDGLMAAGHRVHLANPGAMQQYSGLKHGDDDSDAVWLAQMLRLGLLREGYIYPKAERGVRDLLRQRGRLVQQRTAQVLSLQNQVHRSTGRRLSGTAIKRASAEEAASWVVDREVALSLTANLEVMRCLDRQVEVLERAVLREVKERPEYAGMQTVPGVGKILALTVVLETGDVRRFAAVGNYASYCRCVGTQRISNGKRKGKGNAKNGNRYLAWAFIEAAHFAVRYSESIRRFHQRKEARTHPLVALKTVAHKLARASYYILRDGVSFDLAKSFG